MTRFLSRAKSSDGGYGSTRETSKVLESFVARVAHDSKLTGVNFQAKMSMGETPLGEKTFTQSGILRTESQSIALKGVPDRSTLNFSLAGNGRLYYDMTLRNPIATTKVSARDEGFFLQSEMYDYLEYQKIQQTQSEEFEKYQRGDMAYSSLKYPKDVSEYITPIIRAKIGQLVRIQYRIILSEARDRVAFESFIPAGSELVNTVLATETKLVQNESIFEHEDLMDDRYFGYRALMEPGEYSGAYTVRFTQAGEFSIPATRAFEFYTPEVFGQTAGKIITVGK